MHSTKIIEQYSEDFQDNASNIRDTTDMDTLTLQIFHPFIDQIPTLYMRGHTTEMYSRNDWTKVIYIG